jgi:hypothetical protein
MEEVESRREGRQKAAVPPEGAAAGVDALQALLQDGAAVSQ